jgi:GAF domain-containing protein
LVPADVAAQLHRVRLQTDTLYSVIGVVSSAPDLRRVLAGIVDLLTEATECHACFVYLAEGDRLRLRAASTVFAHLIGRVEFGLDEGLVGWVAQHKEPAFIRENAFEDPRMKYVPEMQEERFQSMVAVPISARAGEVLGVVILHTIAPREFDEGALSFLAHTGALVAGAIENARLYEQARSRVEALTALSDLSRDVAAATRREDLYRVVTGGVRRLLGCDSCRLLLRDAGSGHLELAAADPPATEVDHAAAVAVAVPMVVGEEQVGMLAAAGGRRLREGGGEDLLRALAHQVALALKQAELIERLTEENIVRALFDALAAGNADVAAGRAAAAQFDPDRAHVVLHTEASSGAAGASWPELAARVEARIRRLAPGAVFDVGERALRVLLPLPEGGSTNGAAALDAALAPIGSEEDVLVGRSAVRRGFADGGRSLSEAEDAVRIARALLVDGGAAAYDELGAYRYLVRVPTDNAPWDAQCEAITRLAAYDAGRRTELVRTLEEYLRARGSLATTARTLYIHTNTLRQRLRRIEKLAGLDLDSEDLLSLELAIKLVRLRTAAR